MSVGWPRRRDGHRGCGRRGGGRRRECARGVRPVAPSRAGTFVLAVHPRLELLVVVERGLVAEVGAYGLLGLLTGCPPARPEPAEEPPHRRRPEPRALRDLKSGLLGAVNPSARSRPRARPARAPDRRCPLYRRDSSPSVLSRRRSSPASTQRRAAPLSLIDLVPSATPVKSGNFEAVHTCGSSHVMDARIPKASSPFSNRVHVMIT